MGQWRIIHEQYHNGKDFSRCFLETLNIEMKPKSHKIRAKYSIINIDQKIIKQHLIHSLSFIFLRDLLRN
jgi:hypothetical protein